MTRRGLHLVIPAYNPGPALADFLPALLSALAKSGKPHRVLLVDDGSRAEESLAMDSLCEVLRSGYPSLEGPLRLTRNTGKGAAICAGWQHAQPGTLLAFMDADGSTPPEELLRLWEAWEQRGSARCVMIASRKRVPGRRVRARVKRHVMGRIFATATNAVLGLGIHDTQCGCKLLARECLEAVISQVTEPRFIFDVELLALLRHAGAEIIEVPVDWADLGRSTVRYLHDVPSMVLGLMRIRIRSRNWPRIQLPE